MQHRYVGAEPRYQGRTALLTFHSSDRSLVLVQFDERTYSESGRMLHLGWHEFPAADWERVTEAA